MRPTLSAGVRRCCVVGCDHKAQHELQASITCERIGLEDSTVESAMCCEHFDMLSIGPPFVYLTVSGFVEEEA